MAGMKFEYDESGAKFVYFLISFYAMIIIPVTYYFWPRKETKKAEHAEELSCFEPCRIKNQLLNKNEPRKKMFRKISTIVIVIGWIIFFILAYKASQIEIEHKEYDPFAILGIDRESSDSEIKKRYRELSRVMHPDKGGSEEKFKELAKAYQALTDEETKKNWQEYGNPDGPGATQFGIALPKWMVEGKNSYLVLGVYVLIFIIIMPIFVGAWWYKSIKYTGESVLIETSNNYFIFIVRNPIINIKKAIFILSTSREFHRPCNPEIEERPSDNIEVPKLIKEIPELQGKMKEHPYIIKAKALLYAHLNRLELPPDSLLKDKYTIVKKSPFLINEIVNRIASLATNPHMLPKHIKPPTLESMENVMRLSQMIVQGLVYKNKSNLLQLPHIEESHLRHFTTKKRNIVNIKQFVTMKDSDRRSVLRHLTDEQYDDIMRVCTYYPLVEMDVKVQVEDDEDDTMVTCEAIVTLIVNLNRQSLSVEFDKEDESTLAKSSLTELDNQADTNNENIDDENRSKIEEVKAKSNHKPWEKQKKKSKTAKAKSKTKAKPAVKKAVTTTAKTQSTEGGTSAAETNEEAAAEKLDDNEESDAGENDSAAENEGAGEDSEPEETNRTSNNNNNTNKNNTSRDSTNRKHNDSGDNSNNNNNNANNAEDDQYFEKFQQYQKKKEKLETKKKISHRVYCPFFPEIKQEYWWLYLADKKQNAILSAPVHICSLRNTEEVELKFLAPKNPGNYTYSLILRSDSYLDFDVIQPLKIEVHPSKKPVENHPQYDFTDEETGKNGDDDEDNEFTTESENDSD